MKISVISYASIITFAIVAPISAEVIAGLNHIQPTAVTTTVSNLYATEQVYTGGAAALIDGSGISTATGYASTPGGGGVNSSAGLSADSGGLWNIVFDLGAVYNLDTVRIWSNTIGYSFGAGGGGAMDWGAGPLRNFTIGTSLSYDVSLSSPTDTSGYAFSAPTVSLQVDDLPSPAALYTGYPTSGSPSSYAGTSISLGNVSARYVMFSARDVGDRQSGYYTNMNGRQNFALNEVRFTGEAIPEPSALALLGLGTLGLVARRRRMA